MKDIIVTITNKSKDFLYDIEVPVELEIDKLKDDIVEALNGYNPELFLNTASIGIFCNRINRMLDSGETLHSAGVWNGDYITIVEV